MNRYQYVVTVETDTREHAVQVMAERLQPDEEYTDTAGQTFDYTIPYTERESCAACNSWYDPKPKARVVTCDGGWQGCIKTPVTYIDTAGFAYCMKCGPIRRESEPCRKLRPWEQRRIERGVPLARY